MSIFSFIVSLFVSVSYASDAPINFGSVTINSSGVPVISGSVGAPADFSAFTGTIRASCPVSGEYVPYLTSSGSFSFEMSGKTIDPGYYECVLGVLPYPLVNTNYSYFTYRFTISPEFSAYFETMPDSVEVGKNVRLVLHTSEPVQVLKGTSLFDSVALYDSVGSPITLDSSYNPIVNISYITNSNDPRVIYDLKFPLSYTGLVQFGPSENLLRYDGLTPVDPLPYVGFVLNDPVVSLDGSGNVLASTGSILNEYLTGATFDTNISSSPNTLAGNLLDLKSYVFWILGVLVFVSLIYFYQWIFR